MCERRKLEEVLIMSDDQFKDFWPCFMEDETNEDKTLIRDDVSKARLSGKVLKYKNFIKNYQPKIIKSK